MKPALLVVDVQKRFFKIDPVTTQSLDKAIETINAAIELFREKKLPVIAIQHLDPEEGLISGHPNFDLPDSLNIFAADLHIHKTYMNSFNKTSLADVLRRLGVDTVVVTGYCAEYCVLTTARGALDLDLTAMVLRGSIASGTSENIRFVESICEVVSLGVLEKMLE